MKTRSCITIPCTLLLWIALFSFTIQASPVATAPLAKEGVLDLRDWDFKRAGPVKLYGQWLFYWKKLIPAATIQEDRAPQPTGFLTIPHYWNDYVVDGKPLEGEGYASFSLTVLLAEGTTNLAFKLKDIQTAYQLFVNGKEVAANGRVGTDRMTSVPSYAPLVADFEVDQPELTIVIHVSNFHHRKGGIRESIELGYEPDIRALREKRLTWEIFLIGCILIIGLYHLGLVMVRRKDLSSLYFGVFCLVIALRSLTTGERYINQLLPSVSWELIHKLEYVSFYGAVPIFMMFLHSLFPRELSQKVVRALQLIGVLYTGVVIVTPAIIYSHSVQSYQVITSLAGLFAIYALVSAIFRKREGALILLAGFLFLFAMVINEILHANEIIHTGFYLSSGFFVFIFSQAYLIALRFSSTYNTVEQQTIELFKTNDAYRKEIAERKKLEQNLLESHEQFKRSRIAIILGLAKLAEYRDEDTGTHLERMREYCRILAMKLSGTPEYQGYITEDYINDLYQSAILHDIGKVGIPDAILLKPAKLTADEFNIIKQHCIIGGDAIQNVESKMNMRSFLTLGKEIAYYHHEKWDGSGYPRQLAGKSIPLSARIVALADVYDALTSERPYKKAFSHEKARSIILEGACHHFDPAIIAAFLATEPIFEQVRRSMEPNREP